MAFGSIHPSACCRWSELGRLIGISVATNLWSTRLALTLLVILVSHRDTTMTEGGIYSIDNGDGEFGVVKY